MHMDAEVEFCQGNGAANEPLTRELCEGSAPFTRHSERGIVALEFGLILPLFCMLLLGVIEFGFYMVKYEVVVGAVSSMANEIQNTPLYYPSTLTYPQTQQADAYASGGNLVTFASGGTGPYICAYAKDTYADAQAMLNNPSTGFSAGWCPWDTSAYEAAGLTQTSGPYYVAIMASVPNQNITPFAGFWTGALKLTITVTKVVEVGSAPVVKNVSGGCTIYGPFGNWSIWSASNSVNWGSGCQAAGIGWTTSPFAGQNVCAQAADATHICGTTAGSGLSANQPFYTCECIPQ